MSENIARFFPDLDECAEVPKSVEISVTLNSAEAAAVEGWRKANNVATTSLALRELVRLGLLSELSDAYDVVSSIRRSVD